MKKILQKSLCRLHALLLLAVMFVAGSSAWAQDATIITMQGTSNNGASISGAGYGWNSGMGYLCVGGETITIQAGGTPIVKIVFTENSNYSSYGGWIVNQPGNLSYSRPYTTWEGNATSVSFSVPGSGWDYMWGIDKVEVWYGSGGSTPGGGEDTPSPINSILNFSRGSWNVSVNGDSSTPTSGCHFDTRDVFTSAEGVTMTLTNVASRGEGGLNSERKGTGYAQNWPNECYYSQYTTGYYAMYFCNGEGFTINAPSGYRITNIVVNRASTSYSMTSLIIEGVQNNDGVKGTWTGDAKSVAFSTISGNDTKRILVSNIQVTLIPVTLSDPIEYTVNFVGAPDGAEVTLDGEPLTATNNTYEVAKMLDKSDLNVEAPHGYWTEVDFDGDHTFTVTYHAYNYYNVTVSGAAGGALVYDEVEYTGGQIESKAVLTLGSVSAKKVAGYDEEVAFDGTTFTVTYTAYPTVTIGSNAVDNEGNYWTTFSFHHPVSFAGDVTPCIVTGAEDGVLTVEEIQGAPEKFTVTLNQDDIQGNGFFLQKGNDEPYIESSAALSNFGEIYCNTTSIYLTFHAPAGSVITKITPSYDGDYGYITWPNDQANGNYDVRSTEVLANLWTSKSALWIFGFEIEYEKAGTPVFPANTGILVKSDAANANVAYTVHEVGEVNVDASENLLVAGCTTPSYGWDNADKLYYKLAWANSDYEKLGFYWGVDGGHSITPNANKAYLVLDAAAGSNLRAFTFDGDNTVTAIESINTEVDNTPVFNLQGQRVNTAKAGVYVKNGRKFIVK